MKIVIQTQYKENYAWNEDGTLGTGADAYWKFKGGDTYIVNDVTADQAQLSTFWDKLEAMVTYSNDASMEYILDMEVVDEADFKLEDHIQPWETPTYLNMRPSGDLAFAKRVYKNDPEYGYMRSEIAEKVETWTALPRCEREDYFCQFKMEDGALLSSEQLQSFLEAA